LGIITIRDLLEILIYLCDSLKASFISSEEDISSMNEKAFINFFMEKYLSVHYNPLMDDGTTKLKWKH
jgi:hypothetical protein